MTKSFKNLADKMSPKNQKEANRRTKEMYAQMMALNEIRKSLELTQQDLAKILEVNQEAISKYENQPNMLVSTLRQYIAGLGGELRLIAHFPNKDITINQF